MLEILEIVIFVQYGKIKKIIIPTLAYNTLHGIIKSLLHVLRVLKK